MKTVNLQEDKPGLEEVINLAGKGPVLLLTVDGKESLLSEADDFEEEAAALRASPSFRRFLDERSECKSRIPLEEIEKEIEKELAEPVE
jgi:hypothetical protein